MKVMRHASTFLRRTPFAAAAAADGPALSHALIVLNQRLPRFAPILWSHAKLRVFADGGANRVYDGMPKLFPDQDPLEPSSPAHIVTYDDDFAWYKADIIRGDLDSIRPEVKEFYFNLGVKIEDFSSDQYTTDLHKCVSLVCDHTHEEGKSNLCILAAGALGGRFDHEAANINVLYKFSDTRIVLLSDDCLICLLPRTHSHEILVQPAIEGPHCGLIPFGAPSARTTTSGLQWDLNDAEMRFGGMISTSNLVREDRIFIRSDADLLWTISLKKNL